MGDHTISEPLAVKHLPLNRRLADITISGGHVSLGTGQRSPPLTAGTLRLAIVRSGIVYKSAIKSDSVPADDALSISVPHPNSMSGDAPHHLFWAGDAFWIEPSEVPILANAGVTPLDILLIEVNPPDEGAGATPASYATEPQETHPSLPLNRITVQTMPRFFAFASA